MFNTTVDGIVSVVTKAVVKLRKLQEKKMDEAYKAQQEIDRLTDKRNDLEDEADRADRIADRLDDLLS